MSSSTPRQSAADWAAARGEKWREQLAFMEAMLAPVDEPLIHALNLDAPCRVADIGCGGGGTTLSILREAPPGSVVHGFDISPALVEAANARVGSDDSAIAFALADVATAPAPSPPYDRLASRFGVMFYDDPPWAFANLFRWLAPGGRFAFAVWGHLQDNQWLSVVREEVAEVVDLPASDPEAPGPFRYADADKLLALLAQSGFGKLAVREWHGALPVGGASSADEAASFALASFSSFGELLAEAGEDALNEARRSLSKRFAKYRHDDAVRLQACVQIFSGVRL